MKLKRFAFAAAAAVLAVCLLAGCGGAGSSAASEEAPSSKSEASASGVLPSSDENSIHKITDPADAFAKSLGWGPGTAGTSLKSVAAAADMLSWAEENELASYSGAGQTAIKKWYASLSEQQQANLSEAWPLIKADADAMFSAKSDMAGRIEDAGLSADALPGCALENWQALEGILDDIIPETELQ